MWGGGGMRGRGWDLRWVQEVRGLALPPALGTGCGCAGGHAHGRPWSPPPRGQSVRSQEPFSSTSLVTTSSTSHRP